MHGPACLSFGGLEVEVKLAHLLLQHLAFFAQRPHLVLNLHQLVHRAAPLSHSGLARELDCER
jgi:hypothetical protein